MKFSMFVTEEALQVNLTPESDHEKKHLNMLLDYEGPVTLHHGVDIAECQGGYIRNFGDRGNVLAINIRKPEAKEM